MYSENAANSSGLGQLYSGRTCSGNDRRALLKFDLSGIPAGSTINSVMLEVNVNNVSAGGASDTYSIHPLTLAFGEGTSNGGGTGAAAVAPDATWSDAMLGTSTWVTPGGDFIASVTSLLMNTVTGTKTFPTSATFEAMVQAWLDTPASNFGAIMIGNETTTCTARRFGSKDQGITPVLIVNYTAPPCVTPPTAVCQNINVYLDGTGNAAITASDLNGGSLDNCATGLTFSASQTAFTCADVTIASPANALILTGVIDATLSGGTPKAIEVYVAADIADLSMYGLGSANNGGGTDGEEFTFPVMSATAGEFLYIATDSVMFNNWFGFFPNFTDNSAPNINGDDAIELFYNSNVVDVFGDINVDGTGQPWEHLDGWAYRNSSTGPDGSIFVLGSWSFSGINALDGETSNGTAAVPFPSASFVSVGGGVSVTLTVTDGNTLADNCIATVTVLDTISPTASQLAPIMVECIGDVPVADPFIFTDEADNCSTPTVSFVGDVSDGLTCPETITRSYSITDASGNMITIDQIITVSDITNPTASVPATINIECLGDIPAADILEVTDEADNCTVAATVAHVGDVSNGLTCPETITRTYSITDDCGNQITVDQLIIINDITAPTLGAAPADFNSSCAVTLAELGTPSATDNCSGSITGTPDVTFPITAAGTTTVTWTFTDACGNPSMQIQDVIIAPQDVTTSLTDLTITANNTTATYQWIDCATNNFIGGETGVSYTATTNGSYAVIITSNGCSDTSACTVIDNVGIDGLNFESLSLFPNPTSNGMFSINIEGAIKEIELIDMMGRVVQVETNLTDKSVDASKLEPGKYIVQIKSNNDQILQGTIVIQ